MKFKRFIFETSEEVNPVEVLEEIINAVLLRDDTLEQETDLVKDYDNNYKVLIGYSNNKNFYIYFNLSLFSSGILSVDLVPQNFLASRIYEDFSFRTNNEVVDQVVQFLIEEIEKIKTTSVRKQENIDFYKEFESVYEDVFYDGGFNVNDNVSITSFSGAKLYRIPAESKNNREGMLNNYTLHVRLSPSRELLILTLYDVYDQNEAEVLEHFSSGQFDMKLILKNAITKLNKVMNETENA